MHQNCFFGTEPTHILKRTSSCTELIFTYQPNLVIRSTVHFSSHPNYWLQKVYANFNLKIYYPPRYEYEV